ncbi:MAG: sulfite exporter TauE/SafE family protein [Actinomycetota bacterium]
MQTWEIAVVTVATAAGAMVQGSIGIGLALVAGPLLVGIDPAFTPAPLMLGGQIVGVRHVIAERAHTDRRALRRCLYGLPVGIAGALIVVRLVDARSTALLVGTMTVIAAVALLAGAKVQRTPRVETVGGIAISFAAVSAGLPGPPAAVTFNDLAPNALRGTLSTFMLFISSVGILGLTLTGSFGREELLRFVTLVPGILIGLFAARYLRPHLDNTWFRPLVLVIALAGGLALLGRELL